MIQQLLPFILLVLAVIFILKKFVFKKKKKTVDQMVVDVIKHPPFHFALKSVKVHSAYSDLCLASTIFAKLF